MYRAIRITFSLAIALAAAGSAVADVIKAEYTNDNDLEYEVRHMPDLDQNRDGLPNDGQCHCSPTAVLNALIYIANHGYPEVDPGPGFWDNPALTDLATAWIDALGEAMGTEPGEPPEDTKCGTGASGAFDALSAWLEPHGIFVVGDQESNQLFVPTFATIAKSLIGGNVGTMTYGRYDILGDIKGVPVVKRTGGHVVTPIKFVADGNVRQLWVRDPDDDADIFTQSPFITSRMFDVTSVQVIELDKDNIPIGMKWIDQLSASGSEIRLIDGHRWIRLKEGYSLSDDGHDVLVLPPGGQDPINLPSPTPTDMLGLSPEPGGNGIFVVCAAEAGGSRTLHRLDTVADTSRQAAGVGNPRAVASGRQIAVAYFINETEVGWWDTDDEEVTNVTAAFPPDALDYDDDNDEVVVLASTALKIMRYDATLSATPTILDIPTGVQIGADPRMAINPVDGAIWVCSDVSSELYRLTETVGGGPMTAEILLHPLIVSPEGIGFDDRGHMFVATGGAIVELEHDGTAWLPVAAPLFAAAEAHGALRVARSRSNATATHDTPAWMNIPHGEREVIGTPVIDCLADLDGDGAVGTSDLLLLLAGWGPCDEDCAADIDHDDTVGTSDLLALLAAWGPCP